MSWSPHDYDDIPGTYVFDGRHAHRAYALNKLLFSFQQRRAPSAVRHRSRVTQFSNAEIMRRTGTEGIETVMWLVMRGAPQSNVKVVHKHSHAPISNTGAGVLVLENYP